LVTSHEATFVFPEVPDQQWLVGMGGHPVEYYWEVSWFPPEADGLPWRELAVVIRHDTLSQPDSVSLRHLIARGNLEVVNERTRQLGDDVITMDTDSSFQTRVERNRVLFSLRGTETVRRYFPTRPDSTRFEIHLQGNDERICHTKVRYF
jgi:hypothetical protein